MFFKNATIYTFPSSVKPLIEDLADKLATMPFKECGKQDTHRTGFVSPMGDLSEELTLESLGNALFCVQFQEKVLPAGVIRDALQKKVSHIEATEDRKVYRKEQQSLKDDLIFEMLPQAFVKNTKVYGYFDAERDLLVIDASATGKAETVMKLLRQAIGSLPCVPLQTMQSPSVVMTHWLNGFSELPKDLEIGNECKLVEAGEDGAKHTAKNADLFSTEIEAHLNSGKQVELLAVSFDQSLCFKLTSGIQLKAIKFSDSVIDEAQDHSDGDKVAQYEADFTLMVYHLRKVFDRLVAAFGGKLVQEGFTGGDKPETAQQSFSDSGKDHPLYGEAVEYVIETQKATISSIQRKLRIGYNAAARIIEAMEEDGIVSPLGSGAARIVLKKPEAA